MSQNWENWEKNYQLIESSTKKVYFHEKEIHWCSLGFSVGFEMQGKNEFLERPVLIIRKFSNELFLGVLMTSKEKLDMFHQSITYNSKTYYACLSHIRIMSVKRINRKIIKLSDSQFLKVTQNIQKLIFQSKTTQKGSRRTNVQ